MPTTMQKLAARVQELADKRAAEAEAKKALPKSLEREAAGILVDAAKTKIINAGVAVAETSLASIYRAGAIRVVSMKNRVSDKISNYLAGKVVDAMFTAEPEKATSTTAQN
jgi:hypothetical protein